MRSVVQAWISRNQVESILDSALGKANKASLDDYQPNLSHEGKKEVQLSTEKVQKLVEQKKDY
jgi:hypothetical protein